MSILRIIRIDAVHPWGGELTRFFSERKPLPASHEAAGMELLGWHTDCYVETFELPETMQPQKLVWALEGRAWPTTTPERLLELLSTGPAELADALRDGGVDDRWELTEAGESEGTKAERARRLAREVGATTGAEMAKENAPT